MIRKIEDFIEILESEREKTLKIFRAVDETQKSIRPNDKIRSLERMAWHIVQTLTEMPHQTGLISEDPLHDHPIPESFEEITALYDQHAGQLSDAVKAKWQDQDLLREVEMYGEKWANGKTLAVITFHEIHHRGEMIALMRILGMKVPGIYGPSQEEWSQFGLPAME
jgi:uncharacterized damage-inducible protein DinB